MGDSTVNLSEYLTKVQDSSLFKTAESLEETLIKYPDLTGYRSPITNEVLLISKGVNPYTDKVFIQEYDNKVVVLPYTDEKRQRLHSNPVMFYVGFANPNGFGIKPFGNWEEHMTNHGVGKDIIRKVKNFLDSRAPASYI